MIFMKNQGCLDTLVNIFLIILPLLDPQPTFTARAQVFYFMVSSVAPQYSQCVLSYTDSQLTSANLAIGTFSPVRLTSSTNKFPLTTIESHGIQWHGMYRSPGTRSTLSIYISFVSLNTVTRKSFYAVYFILLQEFRSKKQFTVVVIKPNTIISIEKSITFSRA